MRKIYSALLANCKKSAIAFLAVLLCLIVSERGYSQILAWDYNGLDGSQTTVNSTTTNANLNFSTISRGSGLSIPAAGGNRFPGTFDAIGYSTGANSLSSAITAQQYFQFTISAKAGYGFSLSTLDANFLRSSVNAPSNFQWQYSLDGFASAGINIGSTINYTGNFNGGQTNGTAQTQINLSGIPALQNLSATTVTIRIYGWSAGSAASTFGLGLLTGNDLAIGGAVVASAPSITSFSSNSACIGTTPTVTITGTNFTGASAVKFNGVNATSYTVVSATSITAVLPATGVTTGPISITTPSGTGTSAANFTINTPPSITGHPSAATQTKCLGDPASALSVVASGTGISYQWYSNTANSNSGGTAVGTNSNSYTPLTTVAGTLYYYCVVSGTCTPAATSSVSGAVTINAKPVAGAITGATGNCIATTTPLAPNATGAGALSYTWASSNTGVATVNSTGVVTGVAAGTTNITYTVTDGNGCSNTSAAFVFGVTPTAGAITGATGSCAGGTKNLVANATGVGTLTYVWNSSNPAAASVDNNGVVTAISLGTTNITYTVTDGNTCSATSANFAFAVTQPIANVITGGTSVCAGNNLPLSSNATGASPLTYTWNSTNVGVATVTNAGAVTGVAAGITDISYIVSDANGCTATSAAFTVTVNAKPVAGAITGASTLCQSSSTNLTANPTGAAPFSYTWSSSLTGVGSVTNAGVVTSATTNGTTNITYTVTDVNSCFATSANFPITVSKPTAGAITGLSSVCIGSNLTLGSAGGGTSPLTYTWNSTNPGVATVSATGVVTGVGAGTTSITYTVSDGNGCSTTSAGKTITVTIPTAGNITGAIKVCIGSTISLSSNASGSGTLTYTWSSTNTGVATVSAAGVVTGVSSGTTDITYTVKDGNGCTATSNAFTITVNAKPTAGAITGASTLCQSSSTTLTANPTGAAPFSYTWSSSLTGVASVTNAGVVTSGTTNGTTNITYTVTDANGCSASSANFLETVSKPTAGNITGGSSTLCIGSTMNLGSAGGGTATLTYTWNSTNTGVATVSAAGVVTGVGAGTTSITYTVSDGNGCSTTSAGKTITVTIPTAGNITGPIKVCIGSTISLSSNASGSGTLTYTWSSTNTAAATVSATGVVTGVSSGTTDITYIVKDGNGCTATSAAYTITVNAKPTAGAITGASTLCQSSSTTLTANSTGAAPFSYTWSSSLTGVASVTNAGVVTSATTNGTTNIKYIVLDANGCFQTSANFPIAVTKPIAGDITGAKTSLCINQTIALVSHESGVAPLGVIWSSSNSGVASVDPSTGNVTGVTPGTANITYTVTDGNGCSTTSANYALTINALPTGTLTPSSTKICAGQSVTFTFSDATYGSYIFKIDGAQKQTGTSNTFSTIALLDGQTVSVDVANASNCGASFTSSVPVNVNPLPVAVVTANPSATTICAGDPVTFTGAPTGAQNYNFRVAGVSGYSGTSNSFTTNLITNNQAVTLEVKDANGCDGMSAPITYTVTPLPNGTLTATTPTTVCAGAGSVSFLATGGGSYQFRIDGVISQAWSASGTFTHTFAGDGVVTVDVANGANGSGCTKSYTPGIPVTVTPLPTGTISVTENSGGLNNFEICSGSSVTYTFSKADLTTYVWRINGNVKTGATNVFTTSELTNTSDVVTVDVTGSGCTQTFTAQAVKVVTAPVAALTVSPKNTICIGDNATFTSTPLDGTFNYNFKVNGTTAQNGVGNNTFSTLTLPVGTYPVVVEVTNSASCMTTSNMISMTVSPLPTGTLAAIENYGTANDGTICEGGTVVFTVTPTTGVTSYNFLLNGNSVQNGASNTFNNTSHSINLKDLDSVTVAVTGPGGCIGVLNTIKITVNPLPAVAAIQGPDKVCKGNTISLTDATNTGGTWVWSSSNTAVATVDVATGVVTGVTPGNAVISYTFTNGNGCSSSVSKPIIVNALPVVAPITGNFNLCNGFTSTLNDATNTGGTGVWSSGNTAIAGIDAALGIMSGNAPGSVIITYTFTDALTGCSSAVTATIVVSTQPTVAPITTTAPAGFNACIGGTLQLTDATSGGSWTSADPLVATISASGVVTGVKAGTVVITYAITTSCGQDASVTQTITVNTAPSAAIDYAGTPYCTNGGTIAVTQTGTLGGTYTILPTTGGVTIDPATGTITPGTTGGVYTVTYTIAAAGGCAVYTTTANVTITTAPSATIAYPGTPYCTSSTPVNVSMTGTTGGTYSYTGAGTLSLSASTGQITPSGSTAGTYSVIYTIAAANGCAQFISAPVSVTINAAPSGTFSFASPSYCITSGAINITNNSLTSGGTFSAPAGLTINTATGAITPSTSTAGVYTVTYRL
jgi:uncharacterized protein YjdB